MNDQTKGCCCAGGCAEGSETNTATAAQIESLLPKVRQAIEEIRPGLQGDGGDIEFYGLTPDLRARVRLVGACAGCPSAAITLQYGVEAYLVERVPEVTGLSVERGGGCCG